MIKLSMILNSKFIIKSWGSTSLTRFFLVTDSRKVLSENFFIALDGANFKGVNFISKVIENKNIKLVIFNHNDLDNIKGLINQTKNTLFLSCGDTLLFIQDLASRVLFDWKKKGGLVFALTGSNGKTTTKNYLRQYLEYIFSKDYVHATQGNYNNHIGVPITILDLLPSHKYLILELGTNHPGEISFLAELASPDHALITSIGKSHLEFFKNEKNVFLEKIALYKYLQKNRPDAKFLIYNKDILIESLVDSKCILYANETNNLFNKFIPEKYNLENLNLCYHILLNVFSDKKKRIRKGYSKIRNLDKFRGLWVNKNNKKIYFDGYNANPTSMLAALNYFCSTDLFINDKSNCLFIIGDMNEMGENTKSGFSEVSSFLNLNQIDTVVFVGPLAYVYKDKFNGSSKCFLTVDQLIEENAILESFNNIFIKGSRGIYLEKLL